MKRWPALWAMVSTGLVLAGSAHHVRALAVVSTRPVNPGRTGVSPGQASALVRPPSGRVGTSRPRRLEAFDKLPLAFEANRGQSDSRVKFLARGHGYTVFLTATEAVLALHAPSDVTDRSRLSAPQSSTPAVLRMTLVGATATAQVSGLRPLPGTSNYFIGRDPQRWHTRVPTYAQVRYQNAYPGIDLIYYGHHGELEYDFVVAAGASPAPIRLAITGPGREAPLRVDADGNLVAGGAPGGISFRKPVVYQPAGAGRAYLEGRYVLKSAHEVGFEIAAADPARPVVIDPTLRYATYLGGSGLDEGFGFAVDSAGNAYVTGHTDSLDFPTANPLQPTNHGVQNAFVAALDPTGSTLRYATFLGGSGTDGGSSIAVDSGGNAYVTGATFSLDFPTANPLQPTYHGGGDAFVAALDPTGSTLRYATYLGGTGFDDGRGIAVDSGGNAYVTGYTLSTDFPTANPLQPIKHGGYDAFVAALDPTGSRLRYATYLGGRDSDFGLGIAADSAGNTYVTGYTYSPDFPTANPLQPTNQGPPDAFVAALDPTGSTLRYATYLGGRGDDRGNGIVVDGVGYAYVTGQTTSADFPTANPLQPINHGGYDAFVAALDPTGLTLRYATYLGGSRDDFGSGIAVDSAVNAYVTGQTTSADFPTANPLQSTNQGGPDAFVAALDPTGSMLRHATYLGGSGFDNGLGIAVDSGGNAYVTGLTYSTDFPTANPLQPTYHGGIDAFVVKIASGVPPSITSLTATPNILWPPNHKMVAVSLTVSATGDPVPVCGISAVSSNEAPSETNWVMTGPLALNLRSQRLGSGDGRVYTITVTCTNGVDPSAAQSVTVIVPHDHGR